MDKVRKGELPWKSIDDLHRMVLDQLLNEFEISGLTEEETAHLYKAWHRLSPWPDSVEGLTRLKQKYIIATLSNGNISLLTNMAKHSGLPWDVILSSELAKHYKNDKEVYLTAAALLDLRPDEILMCAAHQNDVTAAKEIGFKTAYINRPLEFGPDKPNDATDHMSYDIIADDIIDLAVKLGL
jgi:2-haloacid dehalogenase